MSTSKAFFSTAAAILMLGACSSEYFIQTEGNMPTKEDIRQIKRGMAQDEVRKMGIEKVHVEIDVEEGDMVRVISGPFESFIGTVEEINMEKQTLKAKISMFGRETPVELEFMQIEKLS